MFEFKFHNVVKDIMLNNKNDNKNFLIDLLKDKTQAIRIINRIKGILFPAIINPTIIKINDRIKYHKNLNYLEKLDVLMMLRVQKERIPKGAKNMMKSFKKEFCLQSNHLLNKPYLMHPGPVNRNIEISDEVLDNYPKSLILKQVEMGVYLRMACLHYILK